MVFIIQKEGKELDIDIRILKDKLDELKRFHSCEYRDVLNSENYNINDISCTSDTVVIPVGNLEFVQNFLSKCYGINEMNPIEVPDSLRTDEFLKRKYSIVEKSELPAAGYYFTKYVSKLKVFSHTGMIETLQYLEPGREPFLKEGLYQVSEVVNIISEYRCFVHNDKIVALNYYDGDCTVLPDMNLLKKAIIKYSMDETRPKAYTMDLAVIKGRGTAILEIQPWVGLYGYMFGDSLPYCYRDGFIWYLEQNQKLNKFSNF